MSGNLFFIPPGGINEWEFVFMAKSNANLTIWQVQIIPNERSEFWMHLNKFLLAPLEIPKLANAQPSNFGPLRIFLNLKSNLVMFPFGMSCPFVPLNIHQCQNRQQKWLVCELYEMLLERVLNIWVDLNIELNKKWEGRGGSFYLLCHCKVHQCKSKVSRLLWPDDHYLSTVICFRLEYQTKIM